MCCNSSNPPELIKKVFSSLSMKCASCCCHNNEVDCIALHARGGPICACCLLALITSLCTNYQALWLCSSVQPNPRTYQTNKQSVGVMGSTLFLCFGALSLSLSLSLHWIAWIKGLP
jgi:hypothetical protein